VQLLRHFSAYTVGALRAEERDVVLLMIENMGRRLA